MRCAYPRAPRHAPGLGDRVSGVILYDETIRQSHRRRHPLPGTLDRQGLPPASRSTPAPAIRHRTPARQVTEGLDGLRERIAEYREMGASFAKWRAVITIGAGCPAPPPGRNAHGLARYAALCQEAGLVPIVEPEVLMDGDHTSSAARGHDRELAPGLRRARGPPARRPRGIWCSSRTWSYPARSAASRPRRRGRVRDDPQSSAAPFPPQSRASSSCRAVSPPSSPPPTST